MGNFLNLQQEPNQDCATQLLIKHLKQQTLRSLNDSFLHLNEYYNDTELISFTDFDDIFGCVLDEHLEKMFIILEENHDIQGLVNTYQIVSLLVICSGEEYNVKTEFLFRMFDFSQDGLIQFNELILTIQNTMIGICKINDTKCPSIDDIFEYSRNIIDQIDQDFDDTVSLEEFNEYILGQEDLLKYLQMRLGIISYEMIMSRYIQMYSRYKRVYKICNKQAFENYIDSNELFTELDKQLDADHIPTKIKKTLYHSLQQGSKIHNKKIQQDQIDKQIYEVATQAFCAFIVSDINKNYSINQYELKYLIYCQEEGLKPNLSRVEYEYQNINQDNDGNISLEEYLNYITQSELSIGVQMKHNLKAIFRKYDKDQSGFLDKGEMNLLLKEQFENYLSKLNIKLDESNNTEYYKTLIATMDRKLSLEEEYNKKYSKFNYFMLKEALAQAFIEMQSIHKFMRSINQSIPAVADQN